MSSYRSFGQLWRRFPFHGSISRTSFRCSSGLRAGTSGSLLVAKSRAVASQIRFPSLVPSTSTLYSRPFHSSSPLWSEDYVIVNTPPFAESVTEGDMRWEKAVGDAVGEDEVVGEIETDKTSIQVTAPANGIIEELFVEDGDKVEKGNQLFKLKVTGAAPFKDRPKEPAEESSPTPAAPAEEAAAPPPDTPAAPGIPTTPPPVPPVPKAPMGEITPSPPTPVSTTAPPAAPSGGTRSEHRVKSTRMRLRIAQRLKDSQNTYAMLTTFNEVDMSNAVEMRKSHKDTFLKKHGVKLGFMSVFVKAAAFALQSEPVVNAVIEDNEIVYRDYVDISVAVATPKGLVVPVIRNVEGMNFADIERTMNHLGEKARNGELAIEDMDGGTFTISNGGVFGSLMGTPIINPPQSAILGMHAINDRPVAVNGKVEIRPMMYLALTYDHRLIDGREAVTFLRKIKAAVEDPRIILMDL